MGQVLRTLVEYQGHKNNEDAVNDESSEFACLGYALTRFVNDLVTLSFGLSFFLYLLRFT